MYIRRRKPNILPIYMQATAKHFLMRLGLQHETKQTEHRRSSSAVNENKDPHVKDGNRALATATLAC